MQVLINVLNNSDIPLEEIYAEILLAETRMNTEGKLRFHIDKVFTENLVFEELNTEEDAH